MLTRLPALCLLSWLALAGQLPGREQEDGGMCWDPDIEFPVPCDEDEE